MSFDSIESTQSIESIQSNLTSEISVMSLKDNYEDILESTDDAEIFEESEDPRSEPEDEIFDYMKLSNLEFCKVLITNHKDKDYYLYDKDLIKCIKNILSVPNITQDFALSYENYEVLK